MFAKRAAAIVVGLCTVASANAVVQVFFTNSFTEFEYGLADPALAFTPTLDVPPSPGTGADYVHYHLATGNAPAPHNPQLDLSNNEWLYIWLRFDNEPANATIKQLDLAIQPVSQVAQVAYYIMDNEGPFGADAKRWDGTPDQFTQNPALLTAQNAQGIRNSNTAGVPGDSLYVGASRAALIGAVKISPATFNFTVIPALGPLGIQYADGTQPPVAFGSVSVPEPAALALLALSAVLGRRR